MPIPFIGPIIIAAGTTAIGSFFQNRTDQIRQKSERRQAIILMALGLLDEVSKTIDSLRYFLMEEAIYIAIRKALGDDSRMDEDVKGWDEYQKSVIEWNSNHNRLLSQVRVYYGDENEALLESIGDRLNEADSKVGATFYNTSNSLIKEFGDKKGAKQAFDNILGSVERDIRLLNLRMTQLLQSQEVGELRVSI